MNKFPDLEKFSHLSSTFFGVGLLPKAPGTWGSFLALFLFFGLIYVQISFLLYFLFFIFFSIASIIICEIASKDCSLVSPNNFAITDVEASLTRRT